MNYCKVTSYYIPIKNGTGASKKWSSAAGKMGTYTCGHIKGNSNEVIPSATTINFWQSKFDPFKRYFNKVTKNHKPELLTST